MTALRVGQHVRALSSWEGYVAEISDEEACGQGRLVTCHPITLPATPKGGRPWKPITVTEAELTPTGHPSRSGDEPLEGASMDGSTQKEIEVLVAIAEDDSVETETRIRAAATILDHAHTEDPPPA